jgi:hypothetical protein
MAGEIERFVSPLIAIFVGVALIPVVQTYIGEANLTGPVATLVTLIPFFYGLSIFLIAVKGVVI